MNIVEINIDELKFADYNPRIINNEEFEGLKQSIRSFKLVDPIIVNKDYTIIGGHQRVRAAKELGFITVPCNVLDLDKKQEKKLNVVLNSHAISGKYDDIKLDEILEELKFDEDYESLRLNELESTDLNSSEVQEDDFEPPKEAKYQVELGDVFQLGEHRLMCGDSTKIEDVEKLMNGQKADMVFTDPPYGMKKENEGVLNDNLNYDDLLEFNKQWIPLSFDFMKDNGSWYCWGIDEPLMDIYSQILKPMARRQRVTFRNLITWDKFYNQKPTAIEQQRSYVVYDEKCLFVMGGVQGFNNNSDNYYEGWEPIRSYLDGEMNKVGGRKKWSEALGNQMGSHYFTKSQWILPTRENYEKLQAFANGDAFKREYDAFKREYETIKAEWMSTRAYFDNTHETYMTEVWRFETADVEERVDTGEHATPKPLSLCARAIKSSSRRGESVLDLFGGSGSTLIACEQLNRKCYMMELDPYYCSVIIERWEKLTGKEHIRL